MLFAFLKRFPWAVRRRSNGNIVSFDGVGERMTSRNHMEIVSTFGIVVGTRKFGSFKIASLSSETANHTDKICNARDNLTVV